VSLGVGSGTGRPELNEQGEGMAMRGGGKKGRRNPRTGNVSNRGRGVGQQSRPKSSTGSNMQESETGGSDNVIGAFILGGTAVGIPLPDIVRPRQLL